MIDYLIKRPMLLGGIITSLIAIAAVYSRAFFLFIGILIALALGFLIFKQSQKLLAAVLLFIVFISIFFNHAKVQKLIHTECKEENCLLAVCNISFESEDYCFAEVEIIKSERLQKGTKLSVIYDYPELSMGDIIEADIETSPFEHNSYKTINYSKGIFLSASLEEITKTNEKDLVLNFVGKVRNYIETSFFSNMGYDEAATFSALIFGEKDYFIDEFNINIKQSGVSHVMVVSGMHLAIFVSFFLSISKKLFYNRYIKAIVMVITVLFMIALCGFSVSMLRAGVTYILMALALMIKRESTPENTLGAAVMLILAISPFTILNVGFQLSVLSTFGILVIALPIINYIEEREIITNKVAKAVISNVMISISAMILCMPIMIYAFEGFSIVAVFTNLLISSAVTLAVGLGISGLAIGLILPSIAGEILHIASGVIMYINLCINKMGSLKFGFVNVPNWTALIAVGVILVLFWFLLTCKVRNNMLKLEKMDKKIKTEGGKVLRWR